MPNMKDFVYTELRKGWLHYFNDPHTIEDFAGAYNYHYKTASRYIKSLTENGYISIVRMDGNRKVFQTVSPGAVPGVSLGGIVRRVDEFLTQAIPVELALKSYYVSPTTKLGLQYRRNLVFFLADAVKQAREEQGDPTQPLNALKSYLMDYHKLLVQQADEVSSLLEHPSLWDVEDFVEWANSDAEYNGIRKETVKTIRDNEIGLTAGPHKFFGGKDE